MQAILYLHNIFCIVCSLPKYASAVNEGLGNHFTKNSLNKFLIHGIRIIKFSNCNIQSKAIIFWSKERYLAKHAINFLELFIGETYHRSSRKIRQS